MTTQEPPQPIETWDQVTGKAGTGKRLHFDPEKFVAGDWLGALIAALGGLVVMLAFAAAIVGINPTPHLHAGGFIHHMLAMVMLTVGGAVKIASNNAATDESGTGVVGLSVMPLLASTAGFATMGVLLTRRLKRSPTTLAAFIQQAIRLVIVMVLLLVVVSIAARGGHSPRSLDYVRVRGPYSVFFGACVTILTLIITFFFAFGETLSGKAALWRERLVGPAAGIVALVAITFVGATIYALIQILADPHHLSTMSQAGLISDSDSGRKELLDNLLAYGLNHAMWILSWGMGIPLRVAFGGHHERIGLTHFTDHNGFYWFVPVAIALAWLKAASIAFLYSSSPVEGRRNGYRLPILAPVLTTAIFVLGGLAEQPNVDGHAIRFHFYFWWAFLLGLVWSAVAGVIAPMIVMAMPGTLVKRVREVLVRRFGAPDQQPVDVAAAAESP